jgi:SNF2 family DNA or RNA helicase
MHELPPKVESVVTLPFEEHQKKIYRDIATAYNEQIQKAVSVQGEAKSQLQMLTALLRLRQVCSDPGALPGVDYPQSSPKVVLLAQSLKEITDTGESALIFTQFISTFDKIKAQLESHHVPYFSMNGATARTQREKQIQSFHEAKGGAVMLMTLKTGGVGLNLTKATYIFHIEPWWNPAVENQATDRAHRIGQTKPVQVYRYIMQDSVEEKIQLLKDIKSKRFDALFASSESEKEISHISSHLTQKDFEYLIAVEN